jgi:hypothetical protein
MTFKNKQQEEQETRWRPYTCIKTPKRHHKANKKQRKEMKQTCTSTWSAHHEHITIESNNDNAQWEQQQHCANDESEKPSFLCVEKSPTIQWCTFYRLALQRVFCKIQCLVPWLSSVHEEWVITSVARVSISQCLKPMVLIIGIKIQIYNPN